MHNNCNLSVWEVSVVKLAIKLSLKLLVYKVMQIAHTVVARLSLKRGHQNVKDVLACIDQANA